MAQGLLLIGSLPPPRGGVTVHMARLVAALDQRGIAIQVIDESRHAESGYPQLRRMGVLGYARHLLNAQVVFIQSSNHFVRLVHTIAAKVLMRRVLHLVHSGRGSRLALAALGIASVLGDKGIAVSPGVEKRLWGGALVLPAFLPPLPDEENLDAAMSRWCDQQKAHGRKIIAFNASNPTIENGTDLYGIDLMLDAFGPGGLGDEYAAALCVSGCKTGADEAYLDKLKDRLHKAEASGRIQIFTGGQGFVGLLKRADLFVRPTTTDGDAISLREALWYGLPVIASDCVVRPEGTHLFPSRDLNGLIKAIQNCGLAVGQDQGTFECTTLETILDLYRGLGGDG